MVIVSLKKMQVSILGLESKLPERGLLLSPSLLIRQLPACAGTPSFHPTGPARALFRWMVRNAVLFTESNGFLSSLSKHLLLVCSSPAGSISDTGKPNVTCGLKMLEV